tara:strand:- start:303 stop:2123 length:1821 start_codon:yes stop_codon:yes gene_type:complete
MQQHMKKSIHIGILFILIVLGVPLIFQVTPLETLKLKTFDAYIPQQEPSNYFSILNITEEDIAKEGGYPLPRQRLAEIHNALMERGAIGVGWVIAFPQPDRFGGDKYFAQSLSQGPAVIAAFENDNGEYPLTTGTVILGEDRGGYKATGVVENIGILKESASQGIAVAPVEVDMLVRRMPLLLRTPDGWVSAFGTEVLKVLAGADTYVIKTNNNGLEEIRVRGIPPVPVDSLGRKWISWVDTPQFELSEVWSGEAEIEGRFVFVGVTALGVMPQIASPAGLLEPHKIQAALSESILIPNSPYIPDYALALETLLFLLSVALMWLLLNALGITWGVAAGSTIWLSTGYFGYWLIQQGLLIDVTWALISQFITATVAFYLRFREQFKLRQQIKKQFEHYLDPRQVKRLQDNPELLKLEGERMEATFLFTDVRGFTSMSEKLQPEEVTEIINIVLTQQVEAVQMFGGMVDKFIGDAMMAIFNAPLPLKDHQDAAINAGIVIMENMEKANDILAEKGIEQKIEIGIGVNTGEAVIGNMGSDTRFDYSAIGDCVNLAARLESSTKEVGCPILIGRATMKRCTFTLVEKDPIKVKGKAKDIKIYTLGEKYGY